jgi:hypothetical protein
MPTRYGDHGGGINRAHRREKCGILATHARAAACSPAPRDRVCARTQFHVIHKRTRLRERIRPAEFHFVNFWG